jgi:hypothetical protein
MSNNPRRINMYLNDPQESVPRDSRIVEEAIEATGFQQPVFRSSLTEKLWQWWVTVSCEGIPCWSAFDITSHPALAANIYLVRAIDGAFHLRLYGERAIQIIGHNATGEVITANSPGAISEHLHDYYSRVLRTGQCWRCTGPLFYAGREHRLFESVDIPLIRCGAEADTIIGVIDLIG